MKIHYFSSTDEVLTELGHRIKAMRIAMSITQKDMSEITNLSQRTICNLETGKDTSFSTVIEVLRALDRLSSLDLIIPEQTPRPSDIAALGKVRERASRKKEDMASDKISWKWGNDK